MISRDFMEATLQSQSDIDAGFYDKKQLRVLIPFSDTTLWREVNRGTFPKPVRISPGRVGYPRKAVNAWLRAKMAEATEARPE